MVDGNMAGGNDDILKDLERDVMATDEVDMQAVVATATDEVAEVVLTDAEKLEMFSNLVANYHPKLVQWLTYKTRDPHLSEEIAQDAYCQVWRYFASIRRPGPALLQKVAYNCLVTQMRKKKFQMIPLDQAPAFGVRDNAMDLVETQIDAARMMVLMRPEDKVVCELRARGMGYQEIADYLDLSIGTVKSRLHRCRQLALGRREPA